LTRSCPIDRRRLSTLSVARLARSSQDARLLREAAKARRCGSRHRTGLRQSLPQASPLWQCAKRHARELREAGRLPRAVEEEAIERFIECGDPRYGFARI
jgi:hypothetical protein